MWLQPGVYVRLQAERQLMIDEYQRSDKVFIFLLSTRAGGQGINLTAADMVSLTTSAYTPLTSAYIPLHPPKSPHSPSHPLHTPHTRSQATSHDRPSPPSSHVILHP